MDAEALRDELARADAEVAASLATIDALTEAAARIGARAADSSAFLAGYAEEEAHRQSELAHAHDDLARARQELAQAAAALAQAERGRDETRVLAARRHHDHALAALTVAEQHEARLSQRVSQLVAEREAVLLERDVLQADARRLADELAAAPRLSARGGFPLAGLDDLKEWASGVRAALLVARSGLAVDRDALLRQAAELAAAAPPS